MHAHYNDIVVVMKGDMSEPRLGLSESNIQILEENVEIVFHSAATVRFDEELRYVKRRKTFHCILYVSYVNVTYVLYCFVF